MILKPQDVVILAKLVVIGGDEWSYGRMATALWMSPSEVHAGVKRLIKARLASVQQDRIIPNARNLESFLLHGVPYVFVPELGEITRGMPTGYAGPVLSPFFQSADDLPPVWPDPDGEVRGPVLFAVVQICSASGTRRRETIRTADPRRCHPWWPGTRAADGASGNKKMD